MKNEFSAFLPKVQKCGFLQNDPTKSRFLNKHNTWEYLKILFLCVSCNWPTKGQSFILIFFKKIHVPIFQGDLYEKLLVFFHGCFTITSHIWINDNTIHSNMCSVFTNCFFV